MLRLDKEEEIPENENLFAYYTKNQQDIDNLFQGKDSVSQHFRRKMLLQNILQATSMHKGRLFNGYADKIIYIDEKKHNNFSLIKTNTKSTSSQKYKPKLKTEPFSEEIVIKNSIQKKLKEAKSRNLCTNKFFYQPNSTFKISSSVENLDQQKLIKIDTVKKDHQSLYYNQQNQQELFPKIKQDNQSRSNSKEMKDNKVIQDYIKHTTQEKKLNQDQSQYFKFYVDTNIIKEQYQHKQTQLKVSPYKYQIPVVTRSKITKQKSDKIQTMQAFYKKERPITKTTKLYNQVIDSFNIMEENKVQIDQHDDVDDFYHYVTNRSKKKM